MLWHHEQSCVLLSVPKRTATGSGGDTSVQQSRGSTKKSRALMGDSKNKQLVNVLQTPTTHDRLVHDHRGNTNQELQEKFKRHNRGLGSCKKQMEQEAVVLNYVLLLLRLLRTKGSQRLHMQCLTHNSLCKSSVAYQYAKVVPFQLTGANC